MGKTCKEVLSIEKGLKPLTTKQSMWCMLMHREEYRKYPKCYFSLYNTRGDWQIERLFATYKRAGKTYEVYEVERNYFNVKTLKHYHRRKCRTMKYVDGFIVNSHFIWDTDSTGITGEKIIGSTIHKAVKKRGYDGFVEGVDVMRRLFTDNMFEYLYKIHSCFVRFHTMNLSKDLLDAIRISNKHNIKVEDPYNFRDTIELMKYYKKDFHNPQVLKQHMELHDKLIAKRNKERAELENKRRMEDQERLKNYSKFLRMFSGLLLSTQGIKITALQTLEDYIEVGKDQHICVGGCGYYGKDNTIILSARKPNGDILATIEYNLEEELIIQCRGFANKVPERNEEIIRLINNNKNYIMSFFNKDWKQQLKSA